jgi:hypothetical protein
MPEYTTASSIPKRGKHFTPPAFSIWKYSRLEIRVRIPTSPR